MKKKWINNLFKYEIHKNVLSSFIAEILVSESLQRKSESKQ